MGQPIVYVAKSPLAGKLKREGLYKEGKTKIKVDPAELRLGIRIEMEHTEDREVARQIALDHLVEDPKYYTHLSEMERKYEKAKKYNVGEISQKTGKKKVAPGKWVDVKKGPRMSSDLAEAWAGITSGFTVTNVKWGDIRKTGQYRNIEVANSVTADVRNRATGQPAKIEVRGSDITLTVPVPGGKDVEVKWNAKIEAEKKFRRESWEREKKGRDEFDEKYSPENIVREAQKNPMWKYSIDHIRAAMVPKGGQFLVEEATDIKVSDNKITAKLSVSLAPGFSKRRFATFQLQRTKSGYKGGITVDTQKSTKLYLNVRL